MFARFKLSSIRLLTSAAALLLLATHAKAANIAVVSGFAEGAEVLDWRTSTTPKTKDLDRDGRYGTFGALNWLPETAGIQPVGSTTFGWAAATWGPNSNSSAYRSIDSIVSAPANVSAGYAQDYFVFELTGKNSDYLGKTVRVGVMQDILDIDSLTSDRNKGLQLVQSFGGSATSPIVQMRLGQGGNGSPEMYFWDLTNVHAGDQFRFYAFNTEGGVAFGPAYVGPVSFDIVPEPGVGALAVAGLGGLLGRRRKV